MFMGLKCLSHYGYAEGWQVAYAHHIDARGQQGGAAGGLVEGYAAAHGIEDAHMVSGLALHRYVAMLGVGVHALEQL